MVKRLGSTVLATLLIAGCAGVAEPATSSTTSAAGLPTTTATGQDPAPTSSTINASTAEHVEAFEFVWATINERFYDPEFGGLDWEAAHDRYLPQITAAQSDLMVLYLINTMLWELGVSHIGMTPPDDPGQLNPVLTSEGELGIDVRLLDGEWVITEVKPGSAAAEAGVRPGYLLESVAGRSVELMARTGAPMPPRHERGVRSGETIAVQNPLYGEPGAAVTVGYRDGDDQLLHAELTFEQREAKAWSPEMVAGAPPAFTTIELDRLEGGVGYLRFDAFGHGMLDPLLGAVDTMQDAPGLIIDLRGNHGGVIEVRKPLIDRLVSEPALIWTYVWRGAREPVYVDPAEVTYDGPLVVLVDVLSASSAEEFAGALQTMGRAVVIGERTAGRVLVADVVEVPNGALMIYPVGQSLLADGTALEGHGVIPDLPVAVDRGDVLAGIDPPLEAAIEYLQSADS